MNLLIFLLSILIHYSGVYGHFPAYGWSLLFYYVNYSTINTLSNTKRSNLFVNFRDSSRQIKISSTFLVYGIYKTLTFPTKDVKN